MIIKKIMSSQIPLLVGILLVVAGMTTAWYFKERPTNTVNVRDLLTECGQYKNIQKMITIEQTMLNITCQNNDILSLDERVFNKANGDNNNS